MNDANLQRIKEIIDAAKTIVVIQADNPDADSLGSALALESILHELGKEPVLYCSVDVPQYLRYLDGWDRVLSDMPKQFDASIIVDASTMTLLQAMVQTGEKSWVAAKPCIVLDHHEGVTSDIDFAQVLINDANSSSSGELIYHVAKQLQWPINKDAGTAILTAILGDTQGLSNQLATPATYRVAAELLELGVDRPTLEEKRRELSRMVEKIYRYKAKLIERTQLYADGRLAVVHIPHDEIKEYSPLYNPAPLIQGDMLQVEGVGVAVVVKQYDDGRITGAIRCNNNSPIASDLAEKLGGGGHAYASGFKVTDGRKYDAVKQQLIDTATELLENTQ